MPSPSAYRFDAFTLDLRNRQLCQGDTLLTLNARYFDALVLLVEYQGQLVTKDRLFEEVWEGMLVTDAALTQCIKAIRKCLGDSATQPSYIKTVPKHGYMFIGSAEAVAVSPPRPTPSALPYAAPPDEPGSRARGVLERALANYRTHELLAGEAMLDVLLPQGERLGLRPEEAELLTRSLLDAARPIPAWVAEATPSLGALIGAALEHPRAPVRRQAVQQVHYLGDEDAAAALCRSTLWDLDEAVRGAATRALAERFGPEAAPMLAAEKPPFLGRRATAFALMRSNERALVPLRPYPPSMRALVILALGMLRLRRNGQTLVRQVLGGIAGGAASGLFGGLVYGLGFAIARPSLELTLPSFILVFASLGVLISALGAAGVGLGMLSAAHLAYRHSRWWTVAGGTLGGAAIGWLGKLAGTTVLLALFGQAPSDITGPAEGAVIGMALSLGAVLTGPLAPLRPASIYRAALMTMLACIALTLGGANLFIGSIAEVVQTFTHALLQVDVLARWFGEARFGPITRTILSAVEGLTFGFAAMGGIYLATRRLEDAPDEPGSPPVIPSS